MKTKSEHPICWQILKEQSGIVLAQNEDVWRVHQLGSARGDGWTFKSKEEAEGKFQELTTGLFTT